MEADQQLLGRFTAQLQGAGCVFALEEADQLVRGARSPAEAEVLLQRRLTGEPLEYVLGWAEFLGRRVQVMPGVFIPRRRTEFLASAALEAASSRSAPAILDLCCGSGALSAVFAAGLPRAELHAADLTPESVAAARLNLGEDAQVYQGDLFEALPRQLHGRIDVVAANAPYVPAEQLPFLPREARIHEPGAALDGGREGLELLRRIAAGAPEWLSRDGCLLLECSERQVEAVALFMASHRFAPEIARRDATDATVAIARRLPCTSEPPE